MKRSQSPKVITLHDKEVQNIIHIHVSKLKIQRVELICKDEICPQWNAAQSIVCLTVQYMHILSPLVHTASSVQHEKQMYTTCIAKQIVVHISDILMCTQRTQVTLSTAQLLSHLMAQKK